MDAALAKTKLNAQMLLQVHDELVFEVPEDEVDEDAAGDQESDGGGADAGAVAVGAAAGRRPGRPQLGRGALMWKQELRRLGTVALLALLLGLLPTTTHAAALDGAQLSWPWALPVRRHPAHHRDRAALLPAHLASPLRQARLRVGDADACPDGGAL